MKNKFLVTLVLVIALIMSSSLAGFCDTGETTVTGEITATVVSFTTPTATTFTIDPNGETEAERFLAPDFDITNDCNAPLLLSVSGFAQNAESPHPFTDVSPETYDSEGWAMLNRTKSESEIALGLLPTDATNWAQLTREEPLYVIDVEDTVEIGVIDPFQTATFTLTAEHGNAFSQAITTTYNITWVLGLY